MNSTHPFTAELTVEPYLSGVRIDSFLVRHFRNYTPYRMQRIVRAGQASVNGATARIERRVFRGERVSVRLIEPPDKLLDPEPRPVDVLYEDEWLVVVNKPAGWVTHPVGTFQFGTLANVLQHHFDRQTPVRGLLRPGIVHRIDRQTSGVLAVAKDHLSHRRLSIQFQRNQVSKSYLALVEGVVESDSGRIELPIGRVPTGRCVLMSAKADARDPKPARTGYEVIERFAGHTLVRAVPGTGRNHQIRVHLAETGHPIVCDDFYGPFGAIKPIRLEGKHEPAAGNEAISNGNGRRAAASAIIARHALHAHRLAFAHPITREWMEFEAALPADMVQALARLRPTSSRAGGSFSTESQEWPSEPL